MRKETKLRSLNILYSSEQIVKSDIYQSRSNVCAEAKLYGAALCLESEVKRAHFIDEYPLYYCLGFSHLAYTLRTGNNKRP